LDIAIEPIFRIIRYTHFFRVTKITPTGRRWVETFFLKYVHQGFSPNQSSVNPQLNAWNRYVPTQQEEEKTKVFAESIGNAQEYRFHIGQFPAFVEYLYSRGYDSSKYAVADAPLHEALPMKAKIREGWTLQEERKQPQVVDFILREDIHDLHSRLVTLPTGSGKTVCGLWSICQRGLRTAVFLIPRYIEKWVEDIQNTTTAGKKDIMVVTGSDALRGLIDLGKTSQYQSDFVVISLTTWNNFLKSYAKDPTYCVDVEYGCAPEDIFALLGIGTALVDEAHQHLHMVYKATCYMNVDRLIALSATFLSNEDFIDQMQKVMFPREIRFEEVKMEKYIQAYGIAYGIHPDRLRKIKTSERGASVYSQSAYEKSILKNPDIKKRYLELVEEVVRNGYMDKYEPGFKCIIFVRTVKMCDALVEHLKKIYPKLDIRRYVQEDPYVNVMEPDIRVTTQQSAGTALDIDGLVTNITTDNTRSPVSNLQCLGRLRKPKKGTARYFTVYSDNIKKHVQYYRERRELFMDRVVFFKEFQSNVGL